MKFRLIESDNVKDKMKELHDILGTWEYGAIQNGKRFDETNYNKVDFKKWKTRPIKNLEEDKIGNCWDFVNYEADWFTKNKVPYTTYMLYIDRDGNPDNAVTHSFIIVDDTYWFEEAAFPLRGTHKVNSVDDVAQTLNNNIYGLNCPYYIWEYVPLGLDNWLTMDQYMKVVTLTDPAVEGEFNHEI